MMRIQIYNKSLNSDFWNENKTLKPEIRIALLKIAYTFYKDSKLNINIKDILFLGSLSNYNYSSKSDIDLHILVDFSELQMPYEKAKEYTKLTTKKWNLDHEIKIKGHNVEIYTQDIKEENRSTGVFSLISNKWVKEATPENVVIDRKLIKQKYHNWVDKINNTIKTKNVDLLKKLMKDLVDIRDAGLSKGGEFSVENLVFKILRNTNIIKKLADSISNIESKELSLKDAFDPSSLGVNRVVMGDPTDEFYRKHNHTMKKME